MRKYRSEIAFLVGIPLAYVIGHYLGQLAIIGGFLIGLILQELFRKIWK